MPSRRKSHCHPAQPEGALELHQDARQRPADDAGQRGGRHEEGDGPGALCGREPVRQVQDHAGEETRLGDAEREAERCEAPRPRDEHHGRRDDAPADHDPGDPDACADASHDEVARHLEDGVAPEEEARAECVRRIAQADVAVHLERREPDVHAIEVGDRVAQEDVRQQSQPHLHDGGGPEGIDGRHGNGLRHRGGMLTHEETGGQGFELRETDHPQNWTARSRVGVENGS